MTMPPVVPDETLPCAVIYGREVIRYRPSSFKDVNAMDHISRIWEKYSDRWTWPEKTVVQ